MSSVDWYYARGGEQVGPVSAAEIKRLAQAGRLKPEDLVWRDGMVEWVPARKVRGLFEAPAKPTTPPDDPSQQVTPSEPITVPEGPEKPIPGPPPPGDTVPEMPAFEDSPTSLERFKAPGDHPFDAVLGVARLQFNRHFVQSSAKLFAACGHLGLYAAVLVLLTQAGIVATRMTLIDAIPAFGAALLLVALQYAAHRFAHALERLNRSTPARMASAVFPDCVALLNMVLGLAALLVFTVWALREEGYFALYARVSAGVVAFIVCEYLAAVALNPEAMNIKIDPGDVRAGEEAVGVLSFLVKTLVQATSVLYGVGVVWCTINLLYFTFLFVSGEVFEAQSFSLQEMRLLVGFALLPVLTYVAFLMYYLMIDVLRAILVLPKKIDELREQNEG